MTCTFRNNQVYRPYECLDSTPLALATLRITCSASFCHKCTLNVLIKCVHLMKTLPIRVSTSTTLHSTTVKKSKDCTFFKSAPG
jgi:hypothetical protein